MAAEVEAIVKPLTDKRQYRRIFLPNHLQALLISDPDTDKCAASMHVGVGYYSDPDIRAGISYLLEKVLWNCPNGKYWGKDDKLLRYVKKHEGGCSSFRDPFGTVYSLHVNSDGFEKALDRFAYFFISPKIGSRITSQGETAIVKEWNPRASMLKIRRRLSDGSHPYGRVYLGQGRPRRMPYEQITGSQLDEFYKEKYSASIMNLVIYSKDSLDTIESMVQTFGKIRESGQTASVFTGQPHTKEYLQILVKVVRPENYHRLLIEWPVSPRINNKKGEYVYLSYLLGHEGVGSLLHCLLVLGWATNLSAKETDEHLDFSLYCVTIDLTDDGHDHMQDIVGLLFRYLKFLQEGGISSRIFHQLSSIRNRQFHYENKASPCEYVTKISQNMKKYPLKDWLQPFSTSEFDSETIKMTMEQLSMDKIRIFWESKKFKEQKPSVSSSEKWYYIDDTRYSVQKITVSNIEKWIASSPHECFSLPRRNVFIPTNFSLKTKAEVNKMPVRSYVSSKVKLWYDDTQFSVPKANIDILFKLPQSSLCSETTVLAELFAMCVPSCLLGHAISAEEAGLSFTTKATDFGVEVNLHGYNHHIRRLLRDIIALIATFSVDPCKFAFVKEKLKKDLENDEYDFQPPALLSLILHKCRWPRKEKLDHLLRLKAEDLVSFVKEKLCKTFLECYIAGNIDASESELIFCDLHKTFSLGTVQTYEPLPNIVFKLSEGTSDFYSIQSPHYYRSKLVHYIQVPEDEFVLLRLVELIWVENVKERVVVAVSYGQGISGLYFAIQNANQSAGDVDKWLESKMKRMETYIDGMTEEKFKSLVERLLNISEPSTTLESVCVQHWNEIRDGTINFHRLENWMKALKQLKRKAFIDFFNRYVKVGASKKRTITVLVFGRASSIGDLVRAALPNAGREFNSVA